ncbi:MAG: OmpA family protein [Granulosicoccus sp.]|nr:OmpA family protein [Granulosicoccus sp.]
MDRSRLCPGLLLVLMVFTRPAVASSSDLLVVLADNGRSYVAQHTLSSDGELLVLDLPAERISLENRFSGPEWLTFSRAHEGNPQRLSLWSGTALTRYRHRYGKGLAQVQAGVFRLDVDSEHEPVRSDELRKLHWSVTWLLPANARLLDFEDSDSVTRTDPLAQQAGPTLATTAGSWQTSQRLVTYRQSGGNLRSLSISFSLTQSDDSGMDTCLASLEPSDRCSADIDGDEVPDYRDVCLPAEAVPGLLVRQGSGDDAGAVQEADTLAARQVSDELGCDAEPLIVLHGVRFQSGQSYLDVAARSVLDRVARALQRDPGKLYELGSHTDNAGRVAHNQRLSENRADAVRHYLMLRGVGPNQVRARGYGETSPAYDNQQAAGRRANRRIELRRLN